MSCGGTKDITQDCKLLRKYVYMTLYNFLRNFKYAPNQEIRVANLCFFYLNSTFKNI